MRDAHAGRQREGRGGLPLIHGEHRGGGYVARLPSQAASQSAQLWPRAAGRPSEVVVIRLKVAT